MSDYFGYGVLGFGAGGGVVPITATGGDTVADYVGSDGFTYRYHQLTNTGNFVVVSLGSDETWGNKIDYLVKKKECAEVISKTMIINYLL